MQRNKISPVIKYTLIAISAVTLGSIIGSALHKDRKDPKDDRKFVCVGGLYYQVSPKGDLVLQKSTDGRNEPILCQG